MIKMAGGGLVYSLPQNYDDIEISKDQPKGEKVTHKRVCTYRCFVTTFFTL